MFTDLLCVNYVGLFMKILVEFDVEPRGGLTEAGLVGSLIKIPPRSFDGGASWKVVSNEKPANFEKWSEVEIMNKHEQAVEQEVFDIAERIFEYAKKIKPEIGFKHVDLTYSLALALAKHEKDEEFCNNVLADCYFCVSGASGA
jgi:hypothetical protein